MIEQIRTRLDDSSVEDLNHALRHYRRLLLELVAILVLAPFAVLGLSHLGTALSPPYGLYILGWTLTTWGLLAVLALLFGLFWWRGRRIGVALQDPELMAAPIGGLLNGITVIAERARAKNMEWSGFFGPLRPVRKSS